MKYRYPLNYIAITGKFSSTHKGLDLGWTSKIKEYGYNQKVYASASGVVYDLKDNDITKKSWGNFIKIKHDDGSYTLYAHLKTGSLQVKKGDKVEMGEYIANMGNTGKVTGYHLHFEIYKGGSGTSNRVDPLLLTYVYSGQVVCDSDKGVVKYYNSEPVEENILKAIKNLDEIELKLKETRLLLNEVKK